MAFRPVEDDENTPGIPQQVEPRTSTTAPDMSTPINGRSTFVPVEDTPAVPVNRSVFKPVEDSTSSPSVDMSPFKPIPRQTPTYAPNSEANADRPAENLTAPWDRYEPGTLTKEKILEDPDIMLQIRKIQEFRFGDRNLAQRGATALLGGAGGSNTGNLSDEEVFEQWQNYQRSFAGGQSVTLANEIAFSSTLDEEGKAILGSGYMLYDSMPNIFSDETSWREMGDGIFDFTRAAIYDPVTLLSLGVGKAIASGGTKAGSTAIRTTMMAVYREQIKKGLTVKAATKIAEQTAGRTFAGLAAAPVIGMTATDFTVNVASDYFYQNQLMDVKAQENYSMSQTAVAGLASILLPALIGGSRGLTKLANSESAPKYLRGAADVTAQFEGMKGDVVNDALKARIDWDLVDSQWADTIGDFQKNRGLYQNWTDAKAEARTINGPHLELADSEMQFMRSFLLGDPDGKTKGFVQTMSEGGLVYVPRQTDDTITNFIGDAISWMPDDLVKNYIKTYSKEFGDIPAISKIEDALSLSSYWKDRQHVVGTRLWDSKQSSYLLSRGVRNNSTNGDLVDALLDANTKNLPEKDISGYTLSWYKSILTAHPGTTGLNLKGWAGTQAANTASDFVQGVLEIATSPVVFATKGTDAGRLAIQRGRGSITGAMRRGVLYAQPEDSLEKIAGYMQYNPKTLQRLQRNMAGDTGEAAGEATLKRHGLDPKKRINVGLENTREMIQIASGQKMQDEVTKMLSFSTNIDVMIRREYGMSYNDFMADPKLGFIEMHSPKYRDVVEAGALRRTERDVFSASWLGKSADKDPFVHLAQTFEDLSNSPTFGYMIPFGKFFNNSIAMMSDYTGLSAIKTLIKPSKNALADQDLMQHLSKAVVGWSAAYSMVPGKLENINNGLSYNQGRADDGSIRDYTYDFPMSLFHMASQIMAHQQRDGEVPKQLREEFITVAGAQTFRSSEDAIKSMYDIVMSGLNLEGEAVLKQSYDLLLASSARIIAGFTRPLDVANTAIKMYEGDYSEPDRNVNGDDWTEWSWTKKATPYVDEFFELLGAGAEESPRRADLASSIDRPADQGKILLGVRGTPSNSPVESMLNAVGRRPWQSFQWGGDPELKNYMNELAGPVFEAYTEEMLYENPDFYSLSLPEQQIIVDGVISAVREEVTRSMESSGGDFRYRGRLAKVNRDDLRRSMEILQIEGNPIDLLKNGEAGMTQLNVLLDFAEDYDNQMFGR